MAHSQQRLVTGC